MSAEAAENMVWHDIYEPGFVLEGLYWHRRGGGFRRIPEGIRISERVDGLADNTAGVMLRFRSGADSVKVRVKLKRWQESLMGHMTQTGSAGFDLYAGEPGAMVFAGASVFPVGADGYTAELFRRTGESRVREFILHFPLYSGVETLEVGLPDGAEVLPPTPWRDRRPVVVYGTSIQQGGCVSRPGMGHTNQMSRMLNRPFLNFGFSGSGLGEPEMAEVLAGIADPAMYVLDYDANAGIEGLRKTLPQFIDILRGKHPETPILLVSRLPMREEFLSGCAFTPERMEFTRIHMEEVARRRAAGERHLHFLDGSGLYGPEPSECTVDGIHATDLGMYFVARTMAPVIERILAAR